MKQPGDVAAGYRACARLTRRHGTTYFWGALLLPGDRRRHVHGIYAMCRLADDIVDGVPQPDVTGDTGLAPDDVPGRLQAFQARVHRARDAVAAGRPAATPTLTAIGTTLTACEIPDTALDRFFAAMRADLTVTGYDTWQDLLGYMDGSAAVVGEMMLPVLGPADPVAALPAARALGLAFQLTNFLRDVEEDLDRGRVYLPREDLERFGADPWQRRATPAWQDLMAFQVARNRELYRQADEGLPLLPQAAARCVGTARVLYARILDLIEEADHDVFGRRLRVPTRQKAALAARALFSASPPAPC